MLKVHTLLYFDIELLSGYTTTTTTTISAISGFNVLRLIYQDARKQQETFINVLIFGKLQYVRRRPKTSAKKVELPERMESFAFTFPNLPLKARTKHLEKWTRRDKPHRFLFFFLFSF